MNLLHIFQYPETPILVDRISYRFIYPKRSIKLYI